MPYNASVRKFALVLSCKSKSAYRWVREKFSRHLPSVRTLRSWHANSSSDFQIGFNGQTVTTLTELANKERSKGREMYVSMCHDEIFIRKHVQWVHPQKRYSGLVTYGRRHEDEHPVANNAIFFLVNLVESGRSLILGYFLIKSLTGIEKAQLLKDVIARINNTGVCLISMSFDGLATNFTACEILGASFDIHR